MLRLFVENGEHKTDVHIDNIKESSDKFEFTAKFPRYMSDGRYWDYVNSEIRQEVFSDFYQYLPNRNTTVDDKTKSIWEITVDEAFRQGEMVSLRFVRYYFLRGAAHPAHQLYSKNFLGRDIGKISLVDLFDNDSNSVQRLRAIVIEEIRKEFVNLSEPPVTFLENGIIERDDQLWRAFSNWNFDSEGITLNFGDYVILPYVYGPRIISIPWASLPKSIPHRVLESEFGKFLKIDRD